MLANQRVGRKRGGGVNILNFNIKMMNIELML